MNRCIITPTYSKHFPFIVNYLKSFDKYLQDRNFPIFFVVNAAEYEDLADIIKEYGSDLNITIIEYETVLKAFDIYRTPAKLLLELGRISFQTIKKFYSALYLGYEQFLVLDSESIMIKETNMDSLFDGYFQNPCFFVSKVSERPKKFKEGFTYGFLQSASQMTNYPMDYWTLESYNWFLELRILKKMIAHYGSLYERISNTKLPGMFKDEGIEGELLYYPFIIYTPGQFGYTVLETIPELKKSIGWWNTQVFLHHFHHSWRKHGGYLEGLMNFVTEHNVEGMRDFMKSHYLPILRVSRVIGSNRECLDATSQCKVVLGEHIHILASSYPERYLEEIGI